MNSKHSNIFELIEKIYLSFSSAKEILLDHSLKVLNKSLQIVESHPELTVDLNLIEEGALVHDIGMIKTLAPDIFCYGDKPYICHGVEGAHILIQNGFSYLAGFAENHVGSGILVDEIEKHGLPLPKRDMVPVSVEEEIVCFADKFYSKGKRSSSEKTLEEIKSDMFKFGEAPYNRFLLLAKKLG
ncbi:HDIG domain-containing protein [Marinilabiliaceae bacterium ANBcel2]|nr:HDIG domain-containing protein [Marinilabiliaceae bacterium ANBcel2]